MFLLECAVFHRLKSGFIKEQEISGLLSNFRSRTSLTEIPMLGDFLF